MMEKLLKALQTYELREFEETKHETMEDIPQVINLAYTTTESEEHEVQVNFDIEKLEYQEYINGELKRTQQLNSLEDFIEDLSRCTFEEIVSDILCMAEELEEEEEVIESPTKERLEELATNFLWGLIEDDRQTAIEFFIRNCDMTKEELDYFGVELTDEEKEEYEEEF